MATFGQMFKELRVAKRLTLRAFCSKHDLDPGNISKLERGRLQPPESDELLARYATWLGLEEGTEGWDALFDCAKAERGKIPADLLSDQELIEKLPVLFRMIRGTKANGEGLDELIEKIRRA